MDDVFRVGILFEVLGDTAKKVKTVVRMVGKVQEPLNRINRATEQVTRRAERIGGGFRRAAPGVNRFARAVKKAQVQVQKVVRDSEKIKGKFDAVRDAGMGMAAAGGAISAPMALFSGKAMEYSEGLGQISTMLDKETTLKDVQEKYGQDILKLAVDVGKSPALINEAFYQGLSAGISPEDIVKGLETAGTAAVGGSTSIITAIDGLTSVVNAYGKDVISLDQTSDLMFKAVNLGKTTFGELSSSLFNVLPAASGAGVGFDQVTAALAAITAQGTPTSSATTMVRQAINELAQEGTKTSKLFGELSGTSFREFVKQGGSVQDALQMLEKYAKENNIGINDLFSSVEAGGAALMLTGKGTDKFTNALKEMENASGATEEAFKKMTSDENVKFRWDQFLASMEAVSITMGQLLLPTVNKLLTGVNRVLKKIQTFTAAHPKLAKSIMLPIAALGILLTVLGTTIMTVGIIGGSIMQFITTAKTLVRVIRGLNLAFLTSPVFWVIAGIIALIAVGYLLIKNWDTVKMFFIGLWQKITAVFQKAFEKIQKLLTGVPGWLLGVLAVFLPFLGIPLLVIKYWGPIRGFFQALFGGVKTVFTAITGLFGRGITWIKTNWKKLAALLLWLNPFTGPVMAARKMAKLLQSINLFAIGARLLDSLAQGIQSTVNAPFTAVKEAAGKIRNLLPFSPAKEGPLRDLARSGPGLMETVSRGITAGPLVSKVTGVLGAVGTLLTSGLPGAPPAGAIPGMSPLPGMAGAAGGIQITINYNPVINGGNKEELGEIITKHSEDLRRIILETVREAEEQKARRSYTK